MASPYRLKSGVWTTEMVGNNVASGRLVGGKKSEIQSVRKGKTKGRREELVTFSIRKR
jgi:hypothetical protein